MFSLLLLCISTALALDLTIDPTNDIIPLATKQQEPPQRNFGDNYGEYRGSFTLGLNTRPMLRFVQPVQDALIQSGKLTLQLVLTPPDLSLSAMHLFFCIELIYRHGHERRCYVNVKLPWTATIDGLQEGKTQILATLEQNTSAIDPHEPPEFIESITVAKTTVGFSVEDASETSTMQITCPRPKEHLSTPSVDVAMRISNFKLNAEEAAEKNEEDAGYFCITFVQDVGHPHKEKKINRCVVPESPEVVMTKSFPNGMHAVSARLYSNKGVPMKNQAAATSTIFRVSSLSADEQNKTGPLHWPDVNNDYTLIDLEIFQQENVPPPIIHVAIMSVRSYNRYHETIVMIKSLLFHRKTR